MVSTIVRPSRTGRAAAACQVASKYANRRRPPVIGAIEVDLGAIRRNVARLRALVAPARLAIVVKADAYGHGLIRIARAAA
ncbi:MAG: alanine racemase, partial [Vulcanimicrobiaceae bacterium]